MTHEFVHESRPGRVVFAVGARTRLAEEVDRLGLRRLIVVCTPEQADLAAELTLPLRDRIAALHPHATRHVPTAVAATAVARSREASADGCIAVGGGSAIGLAKAIAKDTGLPSVAVPTTYAGSEMTPIWGLTGADRKTTGRDPRVLPSTVLYDPALTLTLPSRLSLTSGINALAHAAEALYAPDGSPITALMAAESARALAGALPRVAADPRDLEARSDALYGAWLAGSVLGATTMSLHHKLCHVLGGAFDLPHAETHTAILPHVLAFNLPAAARARTALESAFGAADPGGHLFHLAEDLGAEMSLAALGMPEDGVDTVVAQALATPYANPRPVTETDLRAMVGNALTGEAPAPRPLG
ncbi:maleylacetate reductase [Prauserella muralis]|uniref:Maleylacetate reductase n=1 Tax=Prauserella muralis TaxID=588067 RepID=A0A2V4AI63_9PSEU|nr:maleylacetate reductase [Prauserella muralis]PXY18876.1 maleylacetate reductase [Prauserella muralis]TWE28736.1 maleylacetate reductase [Prauserella muralis]